MSRLPRDHEHLKTGFNAEAASAARFRAFAERCERDGRPNLARRFRELAEEKDALAIRQLAAAEQVRDPAVGLADALAEERFENDVLYPKMIREVDDDTAEVLRAVVAAQTEHAERLRQLRRAVQATSGDVP